MSLNDSRNGNQKENTLKLKSIASKKGTWESVYCYCCEVVSENTQLQCSQESGSTVSGSWQSSNEPVVWSGVWFGLEGEQQ